MVLHSQSVDAPICI